MSEINKMSFNTKQKFVSDICTMYLKAKSNNDILKRISNYKNKDISVMKSISIFENIIKLLNNDERIIIQNEFINRDKDPDWYLNHWCKTSYYKYKHNAVDKMINFLFL